MLMGSIAFILTAPTGWESLPLDYGSRVEAIAPRTYALIGNQGVRIVEERVPGRLDRKEGFSEVFSASAAGFWQFDPSSRLLSWRSFSGRVSSPVAAPGSGAVSEIVGRPEILGMISVGGHYYRWNGSGFRFVGLKDGEVAPSLYAMLPDGSVLGSVVRERERGERLDRQRVAVRWRVAGREDVHAPHKPHEVLQVMAVSPNQRFVLFNGESGHWHADFERGQWSRIKGVRGRAFRVNDDGIVFGNSDQFSSGRSADWFYGEVGKAWRVQTPWGSNLVPGTSESIVQLQPLSSGLGFTVESQAGKTYWVRPQLR